LRAEFSWIDARDLRLDPLDERAVVAHRESRALLPDDDRDLGPYLVLEVVVREARRELRLGGILLLDVGEVELHRLLVLEVDEQRIRARLRIIGRVLDAL